MEAGSVGVPVFGVPSAASGPPTLRADGIFGAKTDSCVRSGFQNPASPSSWTSPVSRSRIVGPMTWQAMIAETLGG